MQNIRTYGSREAGFETIRMSLNTAATGNLNINYRTGSNSKIVLILLTGIFFFLFLFIFNY